MPRGHSPGKSSVKVTTGTFRVPSKGNTAKLNFPVCHLLRVITDIKLDGAYRTGMVIKSAIPSYLSDLLLEKLNVYYIGKNKNLFCIGSYSSCL